MPRRPVTPVSPQEQQARREKAQQDVFMREVDEAVRQDRVQSFGKSFGIPLIVLAVLLLVGFGGYVWWHAQQRAAAEEEAVELVLALDRLDADQIDDANERLAPLLASDTAGYRALAQMARGGTAMEQGDTAQAVELFDSVAEASDVPEPLRQLAAIRAVSAGFDAMEPQAVIDRLKPLAAPGNAFFGSAGELVGMAYAKQGKNEQAGAIFARIAGDDGVPDSLRARARQIAGALGTDAVDDAQEVVDAIMQNNAAPQQ